MGKSRKGVKKNDGKELDAEETKRRNEQRQMQQLVMKLRAEGKGKEEINGEKWKLKKSFRWSKDDTTTYWKDRKQQNKDTLKRMGASTSNNTDDVNDESGGNNNTLSKKSSNAASNVNAAETAAEDMEMDVIPEDPDALHENEEVDESELRLHEVVIVPVIWRGRHDRWQLLNAADRVKRVLAQQNIDTWVDSRRQYTPGQKFAFWEHKGVKWRIEIGPKDFEQGQMCVCKCPEKAGDYLNVKKRWIQLPPQGSRDLLVQLKQFGLDKINVLVDENEEEVGMAERGDLETGDANYTKNNAGSGLAKRGPMSGDTMEDNFILASDVAKPAKH